MSYRQTLIIPPASASNCNIAGPFLATSWGTSENCFFVFALHGLPEKANVTWSVSAPTGFVVLSDAHDHAILTRIFNDVFNPKTISVSATVNGKKYGPVKYQLSCIGV